MGRAARIVTLFVLILGAAALASADVTWTLQNVQFYRNPGVYQVNWGTATGSFTVNSTVTALTNWDIKVSGSLGGAADYEYKNSLAGNSQVWTSGKHFEVANFGAGFFLIIDLASAMTNAGGTINLTSNSLDCQGCGVATSGYITSTPVPEPGSLLLLGSGLAGLAGVIRRKLA